MSSYKKSEIISSNYYYVSYRGFIGVGESVDHHYLRKVENIKGVLRSCKSKKDRRQHTMAKQKRSQGQRTIYKLLHIKLKVEQHETH